LIGTQSDCDAGYYCTDGSISRAPLASLFSGYSIGDICPQGSYCAAGSSTGATCSGGFYCPDQFMSSLVSTNICQQGYYCSGGAQSPSPNGVFTTLIGESAQGGGDICGVGKYCAVQSSAEASCTAGTYLPYQGAYASSECLPCTQGEYCSTAALGTTDGACSAGYFCVAGANSATAERCYDDHYCTAGTLSMIPCDPGYYTTSTGSSSCTVCPAGKFCRGTSTTNDCPNGYYCTGDNKTPCPAGTYMASATGATSSSSCNACPAGSGCRVPNIKADCSAGFYCSGSTYTPRPNDPSA
jgi:hypothetical protein